MSSRRMIDELNRQIQKEYFSAYFYTAMEAYLKFKKLSGFAHFFDVQSKEETYHAKKIFNYVNKIGGRVVLELIQKPKWDFKDPKEVFIAAYDHEKYVSKCIGSLRGVAREEKDNETFDFLQWFVNEQEEEEESMGNVLKQFDVYGETGEGLLKIDAHLAKRVDNVPEDI